MKLQKKLIKNIIINKKLENYNNFVIMFCNQKNKTNNLNRITKSQFIKLNKNIFNSELTIPANTYLYKYNTLECISTFKNNIILLKQHNQYYNKKQVNCLDTKNNIKKLYQFLNNYKRFFYLLKTISVKVN